MVSPWWLGQHIMVVGNWGEGELFFTSCRQVAKSERSTMIPCITFKDMPLVTPTSQSFYNILKIAPPGENQSLET
jgi:hypothetical protein